MCVSRMIDSSSGSRKVNFQLSSDDFTDDISQDGINTCMKCSAGRIFQGITFMENNDARHRTFVRPVEIKKSLSFTGFNLSPLESSSDNVSTLTRQELETLFDSKRKEPSKISKEQIKEYSQKYKNIKTPLRTNGPWYREIFQHTQPAHLLTIIAFMYLTIRLFPDSRRSQTEPSTFTRLAYVISIAAVFGSQFWMTFVSGLVLFFNVPRHVFGIVQSVIFPVYFLVNSVLMLIVIVAYTHQMPTNLWNSHQILQGGMLVTSFLANFIIRIYLAPVLTKLITIKMAIEKEAGMGSEIGTSQPGVLSKCPHYMKLHKAFRKTHLAIAAGNMVAMAATAAHLYYLATKLCDINL